PDLSKGKIAEYQCHRKVKTRNLDQFWTNSKPKCFKPAYHPYDECQSQIRTQPSSSTSSTLNKLNIADIDEPNVINEKENVSVLKSKHAAPVQAMRLRELNDTNSQIVSLTTVCEFDLATSEINKSIKNLLQIRKQKNYELKRLASVAKAAKKCRQKKTRLLAKIAAENLSVGQKTFREDWTSTR
ncbi:unnamed protein product, partial [Didymodactylos carnosus]